MPACLRSIQRQNLIDWECIAVDDGSNDSTLELLHSVAETARRFRVVEAPHRGRPIVVSVAGSEPRRQNREWLAALGFVELRDFVCVA